MEKDVLAHLREGNLIIYPTDTLPGLGCNACNEEAVNRINTLKKREHKEGLICLIPTTDWLVKYVVEPPSVAFDLMTFSNRPLTIVFDEGKNLAKGVYGTDGSVALRLVRDKFCHPLLLKLGKPIVSTSANFTGEKAPKLCPSWMKN